MRKKIQNPLLSFVRFTFFNECSYIYLITIIEFSNLHFGLQNIKYAPDKGA